MTTPLPTKSESRYQRVDTKHICGQIYLNPIVSLVVFTNEGDAFSVDDSTGEKVEVVLFTVHYHRVPCIVAPLGIKKQPNKDKSTLPPHFLVTTFFPSSHHDPNKEMFDIPIRLSFERCDPV